MSHTPGPWEPRRCGEQYHIFAGSGLCLGEVYYVGSDGENGDTGRNARLMAAAPEMADMLHFTLAYLWAAGDRAKGLQKRINTILEKVEGGKKT